jgi:hypothetical protein
MISVTFDLSEPSDTEILLKFKTKAERDVMLEFLRTWDIEEEEPTEEPGK